MADLLTWVVLIFVVLAAIGQYGKQSK